jgi:carboxylesterase
MHATDYLPQAAPFFYPGSSEVGCLLGHGFTSSPSEMRWLGQYLSQAGHSVYGARLAAHGLGHRAMRGIAWQNWLGSLRDGYSLLTAQQSSVVMIGHSLSAVLGLYLASQVPIAGLVVLAAPITLRAPLATRLILNTARVVKPYLYMPDRSNLDAYVQQEQAASGEPTIGRVRYDFWAASAILQFYAAADATRQRLPQVTCPILLIYGDQDETALLSDADYIAQRVASERVERMIVTGASHNLQLGPQRQAIFERVGQFVGSLTA